MFREMSALVSEPVSSYLGRGLTLVDLWSIYTDTSFEKSAEALSKLDSESRKRTSMFLPDLFAACFDRNGSAPDIAHDLIVARWSVDIATIRVWAKRWRKWRDRELRMSRKRMFAGII